MTAIIQTGGKQYIVAPGQHLHINRVAGQPGDTLEFENLLGGEKVSARIIEHILGDKVVSRKFRNKTRYQRVKGHRQPLTVLSFEQQIVKKETESEKKPRVKRASTKATQSSPEKEA